MILFHKTDCKIFASDILLLVSFITPSFHEARDELRRDCIGIEQIVNKTSTKPEGYGRFSK